MAHTAPSRPTQQSSTPDRLNTYGMRDGNNIERGDADAEKALYSNRSRIPADIWSEVFIHCLSNSSGHPATPSNTKPPLLFLQICRSWRTIALHTARLWNSLYIEWRTPLEVKELRYLALRAQKTKNGVDNWLERSGALPLAVSLDVRRTERELWLIMLDYELKNCLLDIIRVLSRRSERLRSLSISGGNLMAHFLRPFFGMDVDTTMPSFVYLTDVSFTFEFTDSLSRIYPSMVLRGLARQCPSLVTCNLYFECGVFFYELPPSTKAITWLSLTHLILSFDYILTSNTRRVIQYAFDSIRAPNLTSFDISITPDKARDVTSLQFHECLEAPFHRLLVESRCRLTSLGLHMPFGRPVLRTLDEVLAPSLKRLSMTGFYPNNDHGTSVSREDAYSPATNTVLILGDYLMPKANDCSRIEMPCLEELYITCPVENSEFSTVVSFLLKRLGFKRSWKRFRVRYTDVSEERLQALQAMKNVVMISTDGVGLGAGVQWEYNLEGEDQVLNVI